MAASPTKRATFDFIGFFDVAEDHEGPTNSIGVFAISGNGGLPRFATLEITLCK